MLAPICKSNVCFVWPLFPPLKNTTTTPHHFSSSLLLDRKVKNPWYASHTILSPSDRDLKASDYYFLKCMCSPPEIIHTLNHTTSPNLSSSPEQGTSSFERNPTFEKMKILTTLQQKKPKLLLCTEDSKLYVLYISPHPRSLYTIYKCKIPRIKEKNIVNW